MKQQGRLADWNPVLADDFWFDRRDHRRRDSVRRFGGAWSGGLRHGLDRDDAFPSGPIVDGAFTSSAETNAQGGLGQR